MNVPSRSSVVEIRRRRERIAVGLVLLALSVSFALFALPHGNQPAKQPASRTEDQGPARPSNARPRPLDAPALTREIWLRSGALGVVQTRPSAELARELAEFGTPMASAALSVLLGEAQPPTGARSRSRSDALALEQILYDVLARLPADSVLAALRGALTSGRLREHELVGLRAAAGLRDPRALDAWLDVAAQIAPATLANERFQSAAAQSFDELFDALPENRERVRERVEELSGPALTLMARALAGRDDPGALRVIVALLGQSPAHDGGLLRALGAIARHTQVGLDAEAASKLRQYARQAETIARADALAALGGFADPESVELLIDSLDAADELARSAARTGLERLSLLQLGSERGAWRAWWARETEWTESRLGLLLAALESADVEVVAAALGELAQHPYLRHVLARTVGELVDDPREEVALAACRSAGELRSLAAAPALLTALGGRDEARRDGAWIALRALTGRSLPRQEQAWREVLALE